MDCLITRGLGTRDNLNIVLRPPGSYSLNHLPSKTLTKNHSESEESSERITLEECRFKSLS